MGLLDFIAAALPISVGAGFLGSLLGIGGGIIIVPALTLLLGVEIRYAVGASMIAAIATSSGAAARQLRQGFVNARVGMFLEVATVSGAIAGAALAGSLPERWLFLLFGLMLLFVAGAMLRPRGERGVEPGGSGRLAEALRLHGEAPGPDGAPVAYRVRRPGLGFGLMFFVGGASGLLGAGAGSMQVPALDLAMGLPLKVSAATSSFMLGVTAAASAGVYFARGDLDAFVAAPVAVGVLVGSSIGSRLLKRAQPALLRLLFVVLLAWMASQMVLRGLR